MTVRHVELLALMGLGSLYGWYADSLLWIFSGTLGGALFWLGLDDWRLSRVRGWLAAEDWGNEPELPHVWGALVDKFRKIQKNPS